MCGFIKESLFTYWTIITFLTLSSPCGKSKHILRGLQILTYTEVFSIKRMLIHYCFISGSITLLCLLCLFHQWGSFLLQFRVSTVILFVSLVTKEDNACSCSGSTMAEALPRCHNSNHYFHNKILPGGSMNNSKSYFSNPKIFILHFTIYLLNNGKL